MVEPWYCYCYCYWISISIPSFILLVSVGVGSNQIKCNWNLVVVAYCCNASASRLRWCLFILLRYLLPFLLPLIPLFNFFVWWFLMVEKSSLLRPCGMWIISAYTDFGEGIIGPGWDEFSACLTNATLAWWGWEWTEEDRQIGPCYITCWFFLYLRLLPRCSNVYHWSPP